MPDKAQIIGGVKGLFILAQEGLKGIGKFPGAEAIAGVPLRLIELYENVSQNSEDLLVLLQHFKTLHEIVLEPIIKARGENVHISEDDYRRIDELNTALASSVNALVPLTDLKWYERAWKQDMITSTLSTCRWSIVHAITEFQVKGQITIHQLMRSVHDEAILNSLRPASARFDASNKLPCTPDTRTSVLDGIHRHLDNPQNFLVCLFGSPGTGKSAVAMTVAKDLHERHHLAASHFFDKRSSGQNADLRAFVSSIAAQLASFSPEFCTTLLHQLDRDPLLAQASAQDQLRELLLLPLRSFVAPRKRFTIVVDALDECGNWFHQNALIKLLRDCVELRSHLVLFITARPETPFTSVLSDEKLDGLVAVERLEPLHQTQTRQDIEVFVKARFQAMLDQHLHDSSETPSQNDVAELGRLSGDLFELAAIRLRQVEALHFYHPLPRAVSIVLADSQSLGAGKDSLVQIYKAVLRSAFPDLNNTAQSQALLDEYHTVVGALASLYEPLDIQTLAALLGMTEETVRSRLRPLSSVVSVIGDEPIHFYHSTFLEFLLSDPSSSPAGTGIPSEYYINSDQAHAELATRSLIMMNAPSGLTRNPLSLSDPSILNDAIPDLPKLLDEVISRHLRYACLHWANHLRVEHSSQCHAPLVQWCEEKIVFYIETISLLGEVERAVPLLLNAEDWARKVNMPATTVTLLYDARRLIPTFHGAITQSAGAIYSSVLPLMPECLLHKRYHHLADGQVVLADDQKRPPAWPSQIWSQAHPDSVWGVAVSPDGRHVASACGDDHVRILSASTGKIERMLQGHHGPVCSVAFSSDGARVVSGSNNSTLCIWLIATGELEKTMEGHSQAVQSIAFSPNNLRIVSGSEDCTVRIWSVATGEQEKVLEGHTDGVSVVAFHPNGLIVVSGSADGSVRIWNAVTGVQEMILTEDSSRVESVAVSLDDTGTRVVFGSDDGSLRIWFAATGATERVLIPQLQVSPCFIAINSVAFSPDKDHVVLAPGDDTIRVWSTITGAEEHILKGHNDFVTSIAFFPDGKHIASGSFDNSVRVWSASAHPQELRLNGHSRMVNSVAFSADGARVVSASSDCSLRVWSTLTGALEQILRGHNKAVNSSSFSPDGTRIVSGSADRSVRVWSTTTGAQERVLQGHGASVDSVCFSPDGKRIASNSEYDSIRVWSVATGEQERVQFKEPYGGSVAFSSDGRYIISAGQRGQSDVCVWDATTGARKDKLHYVGYNMTAFFAFNNQVMGCVDSDGRVMCWVVSSGVSLNRDDPRIPLQPWVERGYKCAPDGWLTIRGHTFWVPRYFYGRWWSHPSGVVILAPVDTRGKLVFIKLPGRT